MNGLLFAQLARMAIQKKLAHSAPIYLCAFLSLVLLVYPLWAQETPAPSTSNRVVRLNDYRPDEDLKYLTGTYAGTTPLGDLIVASVEIKNRRLALHLAWQNVVTTEFSIELNRIHQPVDDTEDSFQYIQAGRNHLRIDTVENEWLQRTVLAEDLRLKNDELTYIREWQTFERPGTIFGRFRLEESGTKKQTFKRISTASTSYEFLRRLGKSWPRTSIAQQVVDYYRAEAALAAEKKITSLEDFRRKYCREQLTTR